MKKINECEPLEEVTLVVRLSDVNIKKTTTNVDYASMIAFDGETKIEAKMWNFTDELREKLVSGEVYIASGRMKNYQGKLQFNITDIRKVEEDDDVNLDAFYERAKLSQNELSIKINSYFKKINNNILKTITSKLLNKYMNDYFLYPAAVTMHHNYYSGLAYHTYSMLKLSDAYLEMYPFLNRDLVYAGIILHDLGKLIELSGPKGTDYTKEGKLLGHISIGANEVYVTAYNLGFEKTEEVVNLMHIILSHHGELEFGSPKEPLTAEAELVHLLDFSDSRMASLEGEIGKTKPGEYTQPLSAFERKNFYVPSLGNNGNNKNDNF